MSTAPRFDVFVFRDGEYFQVNTKPISCRDAVLLLRTTREVLLFRPATPAFLRPKEDLSNRE